MASAMRVCIYARFSSDNQRDTSIEDQVRLCVEFAKSRGWAVEPDFIFTDYSVSGASVARDAFDRLYRMARETPPGIDIVLTENTDRLTRDLGDADRFYKHLAFAGVRLICVNDGIDSSNKGARMSFTMKAMMADWYLEDLRDKTLRGLEGQALRGFSTGGLAFGFRSEPEGDPRKPVGYRICIDENAALIVIRIFEMYRDGCSFRVIAKTLNDEAIPPPRASNRRRQGWVAGTIREMLSNEVYVGRWTYKRKLWRKVPGTNTRRYKPRPDHEILRFDRPELRVIPQELWDAVQRRRAAVAAKYGSGRVKRGQGQAGRRTSYPFSGLLVCGICAAPMVITGGSSARYYRCGDHHKRGTCRNGLSMREDVLRAALFAELERLLASPVGVVHARRTMAKKLGEASRSLDREKARVERQIATVERQVARLVGFITSGDGDAKAMVPVRDALDLHQRELERLKAEQATLATRGKQPIKLPTIEEVRKAVFDLQAVAESDPTRAREALRQLFKDGTIVLEPQEDGTYIARSELLPLMVLPAVQSRKPRRLAEASGVYNGSCAGRI